jgi:hypothetical protein
MSIKTEIRTEERRLENLHHVQRLATAMAPDPKEWEYRGEMIDSGNGANAHCACGHPIRYVFPIYNRRTGKSVPIGCVCIEASVPYLMTVGAEGLAKALEGCGERLKKHLSELAKRQREAAGSVRFQKVQADAEALLAWHGKLWKKVLIRCGREGRRVPFLPKYFYSADYQALQEKPTASTPGRAAGGLATKCKTFRLHANSLKKVLDDAGMGDLWVAPPAGDPEADTPRAAKTKKAQDARPQ